MRYLILSILLCLLPVNMRGSTTQENSNFLKIFSDEVTERIVKEVIASDNRSIPNLYSTNRWFRNNLGSIIKRNPSIVAYIPCSLFSPFPFWKDIIPDLLSTHLSPNNLICNTLAYNQDRILKSAVESRQDDVEPEHLLEVLDIERILLNQVLKKKEAHLKTPEEWRKHALTIIFSLHSIRTHARTTAVDTAKCTGGNLVWNAASAALYNAAWDASTADDNQNIGIHDALNTANHVVIFIVTAAANKAIKDFEDFTYVEEGAYCVAEMQAWIILLDSHLNLLEKTYDNCYSNLNEATHYWFSSEAVFKAKINTYFVNSIDERFNEYSQKFLQPLVDHLRRISEKIFVSNTNE